MAVFKDQPFGQDHTDFLIAQLTAELANRWRGKGERAHKVKEFLPFERDKPMSSDEIKHTLQGFLDSGSRSNS